MSPPVALVAFATCAGQRRLEGMRYSSCGREPAAWLPTLFIAMVRVLGCGIGARRCRATGAPHLPRCCLLPWCRAHAAFAPDETR